MAKRIRIPDNEYLTGLSAVEDGINAALQQLKNGSVRGLQRAATRVMHNAAGRAPVDKGDLRRSGVIKNPVHEDGFVSITSGFNTPYAAEQHEHTEYNHPKGGEAKYLENALLDERDNILRLIAEGMRDG